MCDGLNKAVAAPSKRTNPTFIAMKKLIALLLAAASLGALVPTQAEAWDGRHSHRRITGHHSCGQPIYSVYQVYGRDPWGRPLGRWVSNHRACGCHVCRPRFVAPVCPPPVYYGPPVHYHRPSHHSTSWFFSFGR